MDNNIIDKKLIRQFNEEIRMGYDFTHEQADTLDESEIETFYQWLDNKKLSEYDDLVKANKELLEALKDASSYLLSLASWQTEQKKFDTIIYANDRAQEAIKKHSPIN